MVDAEANETRALAFNLTHQPWIRVRFVDGSAEEVSIHQAFRRAGEIREISGEIATQDFGILRLLLAILYRSVGGSFSQRQWGQWHDGDLPLGEIDAYLDRFEGRFDLFDAERPFFQVADLATAKGDHKDVAPLIFDLPSNSRLFTNRAGAGATSLDVAEAARWLVHLHGYDVSGIKSGAVGDDRVKGGKGYPIGVGFSGLLGGLYAVGHTLKDTLLLNLVGSHEAFALDPEADIPPWEDAAPDTAAERIGLVPRGPVRLATWQSRRVRLFREGGRITGCLVTNGDKLTPQNMQTHEPLSAWRYSEPQTKAAKQTTYMPREHLAGRALWRGTNALLPGVATPVPKRGEASALAPALVTWLEQLKMNGYLSDAERILFRAVGVVYGSNNSVVDEVITDDLLISVALLGEENRELALEASHAVTLADEGARAIRQLAENLDRAAGGEGEARGIQARDRAYAALDAPYREWIAGLKEDINPFDAKDAWCATAHTVLLRLGDDLLAQAGPAAWVGREVTRLGTSTLITTSRAEGWFRSSLTKTFGPRERKDRAA